MELVKKYIYIYISYSSSKNKLLIRFKQSKEFIKKDNHIMDYKQGETGRELYKIKTIIFIWEIKN